MQAEVLCLEPFGAGSHGAFWRGWAARSRHRWTILDLPGVHWKWRSRHASLTLALEAEASRGGGGGFDLVVCSDMLNLPEWRGLVSRALSQTPAMVYFHENQFTYPIAADAKRDYHLAYNNILTAVAADQVWFNSQFHRNEFGDAARQWLKRMPDYKHVELFEEALTKACVMPPGIEPTTKVPSDKLRSRHGAHAVPSAARVPTIGWVARWEHDKRPDRFVDVVQQLVKQDAQFELILLGQQFQKPNRDLQELRKVAAGRIRHCGYARSNADYWRLLNQMDVVVSTADHEFFGIGIVESVAAGAAPLLPCRLAYPEVFHLQTYPERAEFFYRDVTELSQKLSRWLENLRHDRTVSPPVVDEYLWSRLAAKYDDAIQELI